MNLQMDLFHCKILAGLNFINQLISSGQLQHKMNLQMDLFHCKILAGLNFINQLISSASDYKTMGRDALGMRLLISGMG